MDQSSPDPRPHKASYTSVKLKQRLKAGKGKSWQRGAGQPSAKMAEETPPVTRGQSEGTRRARALLQAQKQDTRAHMGMMRLALTTARGGEKACLWDARISIADDSREEAKVIRLAKCCLKQKAGYGHHAAFSQTLPERLSVCSHRLGKRRTLPEASRCSLGMPLPIGTAIERPSLLA